MFTTKELKYFNEQAKKVINTLEHDKPSYKNTEEMIEDIIIEIYRKGKLSNNYKLLKSE